MNQMNGVIRVAKVFFFSSAFTLLRPNNNGAILVGTGKVRLIGADFVQ